MRDWRKQTGNVDIHSNTIAIRIYVRTWPRIEKFSVEVNMMSVTSMMKLCKDVKNGFKQYYITKIDAIESLSEVCYRKQIWRAHLLR